MLNLPWSYNDDSTRAQVNALEINEVRSDSVPDDHQHQELHPLGRYRNSLPQRMQGDDVDADGLQALVPEVCISHNLRLPFHPAS
ncbi:hypothetical protein WKW77_24685 [Variovorax ureilyticus]|uniref:Uncharacterized protein n=1 Tax=Variovorax ureilyticus TaxID=1836198 RepID=A0ABU8VKU7_9BURK